MIYKVTLNGKIYEVDVEQGEATLLSEYEASLPEIVPAKQEAATPATQEQKVVSVASSGASDKAMKAPLPGVINAVKVSVGQTVKKGDVLIILEAMKMENEITAETNGKVSKIFVQKGATVETGAPLVEIV